MTSSTQPSAEAEKCPQCGSRNRNQPMMISNQVACEDEWHDWRSTPPAPLPQEFCIEGDCGNEAYGNSVYCWDHRVKHGLVHSTPPAPPPQQEPQAAEVWAKDFHDTYERLAPSFGYETRKESAKPWSEVPEKNRSLMRAVCEEVVTRIITPLSQPIDERAEFERWLATVHTQWIVRWQDEWNQYSLAEVQVSWLAWQARASLERK